MKNNKKTNKGELSEKTIKDIKIAKKQIKQEKGISTKELIKELKLK